MRPSLLIIILISNATLLISRIVIAQGLINNGGVIIISTSTSVYIDGNTNGKFTNQTSGANHGQVDLNGSFYVEGDWVNNATSGNVFINNTSGPWGTVFLNGTVASNISGSRITEFENLSIQNATKTLQVTDCEVNNALTVDNAALVLNQKKIVIDNNFPISIVKIGTGYIQSENTASPFGEVQWNNLNTTVWTTTYTIPFGTVTGTAIPFSFTPQSGNTGNLIVATFPTNAANAPLPPTVTHVQNNVDGSDNSSQTVDRFWEISRSLSGASTADLTFTATAGELSGIVNPRAQRWNVVGDGWEAPPGTQSNPTASSTQANGISNLTTWWTLASQANPLPIELIHFDATCNDEAINISWTTASETKNDYFTVEKSLDGINFSKVVIIDGAENSSSLLNYSIIDPNPFDGTAYYRLKQTDFNGSFEYSDLIAIENCKIPSSNIITVSNNSEHLTVFIHSSEEQLFSIGLFDARGRKLIEESRSIDKGTNEIKLNTAYLSKGIYVLTMQTGDQIMTRKILW